MSWTYLSCYSFMSLLLENIIAEAWIISRVLSVSLIYKYDNIVRVWVNNLWLLSLESYLKFHVQIIFQKLKNHESWLFLELEFAQKSSYSTKFYMKNEWIINQSMTFWAVKIEFS